jgi:hypothetical protein
MESPAVVDADRWGEIVNVATTSRVNDLTSLEELLDWLDYWRGGVPNAKAKPNEYRGVL